MKIWGTKEVEKTKTKPYIKFSEIHKLYKKDLVCGTIKHIRYLTVLFNQYNSIYKLDHYKNIILKELYCEGMCYYFGGGVKKASINIPLEGWMVNDLVEVLKGKKEKEIEKYFNDNIYKKD